MKKPVILEENQKKEFNQTKYFPGTHGNPFDRILRIINKINDINSLIFIVLLIFIAGLLTLFDQNNWFLLFIFTTIDFLIISSLPLLKISFGPVNSQVFLLFLLRSIFIWLPFPMNLIFEVIGVFLVIMGFVYEPSMIKVSNMVLTSKKIKQSDQIKFIQIGDIHLEKPGVRETKLIEIINKKRPQFILFTGDFLNLSNNENPDSINQIIDLFNKINQISPIYFVTGSPAVDLTKTVETITKSVEAIHVNDRIEEIIVGNTSINIIGLNCSHNPGIDIQSLKNFTINHDSFNILLYHSPDLIYTLEKNMFIDLMLSGHTHGGQVRLPFFGALFTGSLYGRILQSGLYRLNQSYLYITRGIGLEGMGAPRVRFLCKPEVVEWVIQKQSED